jgi:phage baseplate assembly protein W
MNGTNSTTGKLLTGIDYLSQEITKLLTTPLGSRVMRRDYGSNLPFLVDAPMNAETLADMYAATAGALHTWVPDFQLSKVTATSAAPGQVSIAVSGIYTPTGQPVAISGITVN